MHKWLSLFTEDLSVLENRLIEAQESWEAFHFPKDYEHRKCSVNGEILDGWKRSKSLSGQEKNELCSMKSNESIETLDIENKLYDVVKRFMSDLAGGLLLENTELNLYNEELYMIHSIIVNKNGKDIQLQDAKGRSMREERVGATAVSLCLFYNRLYQTMGYENYHPKFHDKCISATPMIDKNGRVYGVLSLEHPISPWWKYSLSLLSATNNIDFHVIKEKKVEGEAFNLVNYYEIACDNIEQAIIITNKEGRITRTNRAAEVVFEKNRDTLNQSNVRELWLSDNPFLHSLNEGQISTVAREIELEPGKTKMLIGRTLPVFDKKKGIRGSIGILRENKTTIKSATNNNLRARYTFDDIIGNSKAIREVVELAQAAAKLGSNVLIQGESGTGKELFAQAIHNHSENHNGPFVAVNCTAIPNSLLESELFGYDGGAFTGAKKEGSRGKFELAQGGSIFLDEINSMPIDMQVKILRTIQMKTVTRVGGTGVIPIDVRIIVATNEDLWELVKQGKFREDLYYRLNVISFTVPPLRERREDIDLFVRTKMKNLIYTTKWTTTISAGGMDILKNYDYPGNVRELENILERSTVLAAAKNAYVITEEDLCTYGGIKDHMNGTLSVKEDEVTEELWQKEGPLISEIPDYGDMGKSAGSSIEEAEENAIRYALQLSERNITNAAKALGISRNTLYRKMKIYGLDNKKSR